MKKILLLEDDVILQEIRKGGQRKGGQVLGIKVIPNT